MVWYDQSTAYEESGLTVVSIYGSEDRVLDMAKYETSKANLPDNMLETVVAGGCRLWELWLLVGDGIPTIANEEQISHTSEKIAD